MKGYGLPNHIDISGATDDIIDLFGLKNGESDIKRNCGPKRAIRKSLKHSERFKAKRQIFESLCKIGY